MKINGVFEGGGVKGIALAGAVTAAQEKGFEFKHVAGTSSGSIVAALLAAGYSGEEMKGLIGAMPFASFLRQTWLHRIPVVGPGTRLFIKKGLYSGEALEYWIYNLLAAKGVRTFGDLRPNQLRIIASDISQGKLLVLPDDVAQYGIDPNRFSVAKAVRMSTSIPYFFDPVIIRKSRTPAMKLQKLESYRKQFIYIVDGGLLSNFPLWIFDKEGGKAGAEGLPTIGFQLVGRSDKEPRTIGGPVSMFQALVSTMLDAHDERYIEESNRFRTVKIPTLGVKTTEFQISKEKSIELYQSGYQAAEKYFGKWSLDVYTHYYTKSCSTTLKV